MSVQENSDHPPKRSDIGTLPVHFEPIPKTLASPFTELFPAYNGKGLVRGEPGGFVFSHEYGKHAENVFRFQPRKDDVWLMSFPRSGRLLNSTRMTEHTVKSFSLKLTSSLET